MIKLVRILLALLIVASAGFFYAPQAKASSFNPNDLMDDTIFENTGSMSSSYIDSWLNSNFASSCISSNSNSNGNPGFTTPDPQGNLTFGSNVTVGRAIYDDAQLYHINPQVILTTLQKEQSIVSGGAGCYYSNPSPSWPASGSPQGSHTFTCTINGKSVTCTYACPYGGGCMPIAMSYNCPGYCSAADEYFDYQLELGSWILRFSEERSYGKLTGYTGYESGDDSYTYNGPMTKGYRQRYYGGPSVYYDGSYTTSDGTDVTIANGATASLYSYTPFISGNQSFDNLFQNSISNGGLGFGDVHYYGVPYAHPAGTLVRDSNDLRVYIIENGQRLPIPTQDTFYSYGYRFSDVKIANYYDDQLPIGSSLPLLKDGTIFKGSGPNIYVYRVVSGTPEKELFPTWTTFTGLGYSLKDVQTVSNWEIPSTNYASNVSITQHPVGALVQASGSPTVYYLDSNGTRRRFVNIETFYSYHYSFNQVKAATAADMQLPLGNNMGFREGTLIKGSGPQIYVPAVQASDGSQQKGLITSWYCFVNMGYYYPGDVLPVADWEISSMAQYGPVC